MKTKKTKQANLENYRTIFFQIGMILTLSAIFIAFEWNSAVNTKKLSTRNPGWVNITDLPPITRPEPEKKEVKPPTPVEKLIIRENDVVIVDEPLFGTTEIDWDGAIDIPVYDEPNNQVEDEPFIRAEFMPTFQQKDGKYFRNYIAKNVKFPTSAVENGITGTVYVSFIIDKDGSVTHVEIVRGVHPVIDQAVVDAIQASPKWEPGMNNGKYVRVKYSIAIAFRLE